ncbi:uncharacterized protein LOC130625249 [Hydractinia symbiolongicarpus]|uniref:uncharacterized protein LOC130625249 n=1 Tax=Hydractinia symbiolongicarpus TaxID=13093 RepID=UPI00254BF614|nr:uncharacterized protein LOC130625249 [Hydractinia symbiolongicarpus]
MSLNCDDPVPEDNCNDWNIWKDCIQPLEGFRIPRCFKPKKFGKIVHSSIHYFSDASEFAYGQATYLRIVNESGRVHVCLVMGKARVAPLKFVSMPRLELTAATLSVKIASLLRQELRLLYINEYFWTDSQVVLGYLKNQTKRFKVFVANRIEIIRSNSKIDDWNYVPSNENPADIASRGSDASKDKQVKMWFRGPEFLWNDQSSWKLSKHAAEVDENDPEVKRVKVNACLVTNDPMSTLEERIVMGFGS